MMAANSMLPANYEYKSLCASSSAARSPRAALLKAIRPVSLALFLCMMPSGKSSADNYRVTPIGGDQISGKNFVEPIGELKGKLIFHGYQNVTRTGTEGGEIYVSEGPEQRLFTADDSQVRVIDADTINYPFISSIAVIPGDRYYMHSSPQGILAWNGTSLERVDFSLAPQVGLPFSNHEVLLGDQLLMGFGVSSNPNHPESLVKISGGKAQTLAAFAHQSLGDLSLFDDAAIVSGDGTLYRSDGDAVTPLGTINPAGPANARFFVHFRDQLLFAATGPQGTELYQTDGAAVSLVADINPSGDSLEYMTETGILDDRFYFPANGPNGYQLYRTDGNQVEQHSHFEPGTIHANFQPTAVVGGHLYLATSSPNGPSLFATDSTTLRNIALPSESHWTLDRFNPLGNRLLFSSWDAGYDGAIWSTDGSSATLLANLFTGYSTSWLRLGDQLLFAASDGDDFSLYRTDGLSVTKIVGTDGLLFVGDQGRELGGELLFRAGIQGESKLYAFDGVRVAEVELGFNVRQVVDPFEHNGKTYVFAQDSSNWSLMQVSAVPEPAAWQLLAIAASYLFLCRRTDHATS
jgi:ELWxxDGT repeat protein